MARQEGDTGGKRRTSMGNIKDGRRVLLHLNMANIKPSDSLLIRLVGRGVKLTPNTGNVGLS